MTQRYHKAARDGLLDILKETTRKDCNAGDEDGMTPTLWAAFEGKLEALSLLVGRGGDPNKSDHYGNTALHLASARGHMDCVTFLVNFGVNIYSLDIDMHTPQELAAMNECTEILRYLDSVTANEDQENPKKVKAMQEKAQKEANKLQKNFKKIQKKADKNNERDQKMLDKELEKMGISSSEDGERGNQTDLYEDTSSNSNSSGSSSNAPKFSEITNSQSGSGGTVKVGSKKLIGTVKKIYLKKSQAKMDHAANSDGNNGAFTVSEIEDGKRSVRHLQGRRQSANILFVPKKIENNQDDFEESIFMDRQRQLFQQRKSLATGMTNGSSIFETGLGSIAFRKSMTASLFSFENEKNAKDSSIGSAGSLAEEEDYSNNEDNIPPFNVENFAPVAIFLAGLGMDNYVKTFREQEIDLETLTLLEDPELKEMGLPLGPRKKIMVAIEERRRAMKEEQVLEDSQL